MSDISKRLKASVGMDAINGDAMERAVCGRQMTEAANYITRIEAERNEALQLVREMLPSLSQQIDENEVYISGEELKALLQLKERAERLLGES